MFATYSRFSNFSRSKGQKVKVTRPINTETESVSPTNFKLGRRLVHVLSTAMASCEVGLLHVGGGIPCRPHPAATTLFVSS